MADIKQIYVNGITYNIDAVTLEGHSYNDIISASFSLNVVWNATQYAATTAPSAADLLRVPSGVTVHYKSGASSATGTLAASASTEHMLYLVYEEGSFYEYATVKVGSNYSWEKIGSTDIDLPESTSTPSVNATSSAGAQTASGTATVIYQKSNNQTQSAGGAEVSGSNFTFVGTTATITASTSYKPAGSISGSQTVPAHSHTVNAATANAVTGVKSDGTAAVLTGITTTSDTFVKSYPGSTKYLQTANITGVSGTTTVSKATAGTAVTVGKRAASQTTVGNANVGTAVSFKAVNTNTDVNATNVASPTVSSITTISSVTPGSDASLTGGAQASWTATVNSGVLSFGFTPNTLQSLTGGKATVVNTTTTTGVVRSTATTPSATTVTPTKVVTTDKSIAPAVASETKIYGVDGTATITPYTFTDVTVAQAASSASAFVTGLTTTAATGMGVLVGLGTATTAAALTGAEADGTATVIKSNGLSSGTFMTGATLGTAGGVTINGSNFSFGGTSATISVTTDYQPEGTITGSATIGAHTHGITLTATTITGTAAVAVASHTHDLGNHTHAINY